MRGARLEEPEQSLDDTGQHGPQRGYVRESCERTDALGESAFFLGSTVWIGCSCDDVSFEKCLYNLQKIAHKQEAKNAEDIGTILECRGHEARCYSGFTMFAKHFMENEAQATQLQTRIAWKKPRERPRLHSPNHVTKHGVGSVDKNNTHIADWHGDSLEVWEPRNLKPRCAIWSDATWERDTSETKKTNTRSARALGALWILRDEGGLVS